LSAGDEKESEDGSYRDEKKGIFSHSGEKKEIASVG
jgi:hypothetical protein